MANESKFVHKVIKGGKIVAESTTVREAKAKAAAIGGTVRSPRKKNPAGDNHVADTILQQLGTSPGRLRAMLGTKSVVALPNGVQFDYAGRADIGNKCVIKLAPSDTYHVAFWYIRAGKSRIVKEYDDIYCDQLRDLFERTTQLRLSLGTMGRAGNPGRTANPFTIGVQDKRVIAAFVDRKPAEGHKLSTDGTKIDGLWMGGNSIARWTNDKIDLCGAGGKAIETVQKAIRKAAPKNWILANNPGPKIKFVAS